MTPINADLRLFILKFFSDEELDTLCFDYFPEVRQDFTIGMIKNSKVMLLIDYCQARGRGDDLYGALERERPSAWRDKFGAPPVQKPSFSEETRFLERDPRQVFISHATADADFAHRLADALRAEGWRVWIAPESIRPGEKWVEAIDRGLETSGVFVVALTPAAVASRWVRTETNAAVQLEHNGRVRFLPLDVIECNMPILWGGYQYVTFRRSYESGLGELLRWLAGEDPLLPEKEIVSSARFPGYRVLSPDRIVHEKTEIEFVRVPAGAFLYGEGAEQKTLELPEYWIGRYPVTNAQYQRFVDATGHAAPADWRGKEPPTGQQAHPVLYITWHDATAFCEWAGLALPTEKQWEKAARGTDGRTWPWGNEEPTAERCNFNKNIGLTTPVGQYSPRGDSPYGCADMAGNVWEWTASWYDSSEQLRVLRGGSWVTDAQGCRCALRDGYSPIGRGGNVGCRVLVAPSGHL